MQRLALILFANIIFYINGWGLDVNRLTVNMLSNPQGIDNGNPKFGWVITSDDREIMQTSYELHIYGDREKKQLVWSSGIVESDASQNVETANLALMPHSRYWWDVSITDNHGREARSNETAYFDTGVMGDWGSAQWIKYTDKPYGIYMPGSKIKDYTISADIEIEQTASSICFSKGYDDSMMMWRIDVSNQNKPQFQAFEWVHGDTIRLQTIDISQLGIKAHKPFNMYIEICDGGTVSHTYINGYQVYTHYAEYMYTQIGIKQFANAGKVAESAYYDNIRIAEYDTDKDLFLDDFSIDSHFMSGTLVDGRLLVSGIAKFNNICWQMAGCVGLEIDADIMIKHGAPGFIFGWTARKAYFNWQIITDTGNNVPMLRQSILTHSDEVWMREVPLKGFNKNDFIGKEHRLHLSIYNVRVITSIDGVPVDTMNCNRRVPIGYIGMRALQGEEGYFDNFKMQLKYPNGLVTDYLNIDFENGQSPYFLDADIIEVNGNKKCHLTSRDDNDMLIQTQNQATAYTNDFIIDRPIKSAMLYSTALGVYDMWINGERVGHTLNDNTIEYEELKPGWTDYRHRVQYSTHDVTALCHEGINNIGAVVAYGWLKGQISKNNYIYIDPAFMCKLVVTYSDGTQIEIGTDQKWKSTKNIPLFIGEMYHGEIYNSMIRYPWQGGNRINLNSVETYPYTGTVVPQFGPYVTVLKDYIFDPALITVYSGCTGGTDYGMINTVAEYGSPTVISLKPGQTIIYDFGQNHSGIPRFCVKGKPGTLMHLRFAEMLNDTGEIARGNDGPGGSIYRANYRWAKSEIYYTLNGEKSGEKYQTNTVFYGYRYIEITATDAIEICEINSLPISSAHIDTGTICTDNPSVNQLFSNAKWGQRSNLLSVPTDCPQRDERLGWAGDTQVFCNTALYNANTAAFYAKWLTDMRDGQRDDGAYSDIAPVSLQSYGNSGWADAGIIVAWNTYLFSGDKSIIRDNFEAMNRYMEWLSHQTAPGILYPGAGIVYGDWLGYVSTDKRYISEAYYAYDAKLMSKMSKALSNHTGDDYDSFAEHYEALYTAIVDEIQSIYFSPNSTMEHTQTSLILALQFQLYRDNAQMSQISEKLRHLIESNDNKLSTGFLGTAYINTALSMVGLNDSAYNLLLQKENPSWLYSVDQGATTIWERWDSYTKETGFGDVSMNSFNHYAYGAICEWMYRDMAGIAPCEDFPGFKRIIFAPKFDLRNDLPANQQRIRNVRATYDSPYGRIQADWCIDKDDVYTYHITVPANTTGEVHLPVPDENFEIVESNIREPGNVKDYLGYNDGMISFVVGSGEYTFTYHSANREETIRNNTVNVYPNPVKDNLYIQSGDIIKSIKLLNNLGQTVKCYDNGMYIIDTSDLSAGLYIIVIETKSQTESFKIIKI